MLAAEKLAHVVDRDRERDPLGRCDAHRVDADDVPVTIHEWTAAVARVDGGIGLRSASRRRPAGHRSTIPRVTVFCSTPSADPMATTSWPARMPLADPERGTIGLIGRAAMTSLSTAEVEIVVRRSLRAPSRVARSPPDAHREVRTGDVRVGDDGVRADEDAAAAAGRRLDDDDGGADAGDEILERHPCCRLRQRRGCRGRDDRPSDGRCGAHEGRGAAGASTAGGSRCLGERRADDRRAAASAAVSAAGTDAAGSGAGVDPAYQIAPAVAPAAATSTRRRHLGQRRRCGSESVRRRTGGRVRVAPEPGRIGTG